MKQAIQEAKSMISKREIKLLTLDPMSMPWLICQQGILDLQELVDRLESKQHYQGWISVADSLPETNGYYYVLNGGKTYPCFFNIQYKTWQHMSIGEIFNDIKHVTHWQSSPRPLPTNP